MWGQAQGAAVFFRDDGIIPTRVGTSILNVSNKRIKEDHPHACGDKSGDGVFTMWEIGSSPRVWGQEDGDFWHTHR